MTNSKLNFALKSPRMMMIDFVNRLEMKKSWSLGKYVVREG